MNYSSLRPPRFDDAQFDARADAIRERLTSALRIVDQVTSMPASRLADPLVTEGEIRAIVQSRRERDRFFDGELFADPAWDILLSLYAARLGQQRISTGDLCLAAAVPSTTALRWITLLEEKGLIERKPDPFDRRRCHVSLSSSGLDAMASYFQTVPR